MEEEVVDESDSHSDDDEAGVADDDDDDAKEKESLLLTIDQNLGRAPTKLRLQRTQTNAQYQNMENESMFSAEYLEQSEKFVQAAINICEAQDIIPRIFNMKVHVAVGLSILCTSFAVLPTAVKLAFGNDCQEWSN